ncbi:hypothetical protein BH11ACT8_BH11ACT8_25700 [soil metagenome]
MVRLVIVTGSGRSGTSSVAGTLKRFGFHIPQPEVETDERNPLGYYEPRWVASFHKRWLNRIPVRTIDARPDAGRIAMETLTPKRTDNLRRWLAEQVEQVGADDVMVIKETRAYWVYPLWEDVAQQVGVDLVSLTMLRHPAQVVRSRDSAYLTHESEETRLERETANVAAWMNSIFVTESATRGNDRAFVPYYDLIGDWRTAMTRACGQIGVEPGDLSAPHPVDDFITPNLNRSSDSWEGLHVPDWLRDLAERTWAAADVLVERPFDPDAQAELEALAADYAPRYRTAAALATDEVEARVLDRTRVLEREAKGAHERLDKKNETIKALRAELRALKEGT